MSLVSQPQQLSQVALWYHQEYSGAWNSYQSALVPIQVNYNTCFGTGKDSLRIDIANWIDENMNPCRATSPPPHTIREYDQYQPDISDKKFGKCTKTADEDKAMWETVLAFADAYLHMATTLMNFASQSIVIMHMSSFCDPAQFDESTITEKCEWNSVIRNLLSKVFARLSALLLQGPQRN
jgi:hypothetical protein